MIGTVCADVSPERLKALSQSVYSDDSHERISAVVELTTLGPQAEPALPALRAALAREREPNIKELMITAIQRIEGGGLGAPSIDLKPSDLRIAARKNEALIKQLSDANAGQRADAARKLRMMGALAEPALGVLRKVSRESTDETVRSAAQEAAGDITLELWFYTSDSPPQESMEEHLGRIVAQLVKKLDDATPAVRIKAIRQLMRMEAAGALALPQLRQMAEKDLDTLARRSAGMAAKRIAEAQIINDAWYKAAAELEHKKQTPNK